MTGPRLYGADGELLVDLDREKVRDALLSDLATGMMLVLEARKEELRALASQGVRPDARMEMLSHATELHELQESILRGSIVLFGEGGG